MTWHLWIVVVGLAGMAGSLAALVLLVKRDAQRIAGRYTLSNIARSRSVKFSNARLRLRRRLR